MLTMVASPDFAFENARTRIVMLRLGGSEKNGIEISFQSIARPAGVDLGVCK